MKFCLIGLKHIYAKDEWTKVMNNDIVTQLRCHNIEGETSKRRSEAEAALLLPRDIHHCLSYSKFQSQRVGNAIRFSNMLT